MTRDQITGVMAGAVREVAILAEGIRAEAEADTAVPAGKAMKSSRRCTN
jgi:hypothetical protein